MEIEEPLNGERECGVSEITIEISTLFSLNCYVVHSSLLFSRLRLFVPLNKRNKKVKSEYFGF